MLSIATIAVVLLACSTQLALTQFVANPQGFTEKTGYANVKVRYKQVPAGICEMDPDVKSYSGYADVAENQHIFWWFFEARNMNASEAPLTVWINGGPGSSSMIGLFQELGPCTVNSSGDAVDNPYSWSNVSNMLFIDEPTQVGLSYSKPVPAYVDPDTSDIIVLPNNTCPDYAEDLDCGTYSLPDLTLTANSTPAAAPNMWKTLQGFMGAFPQYARDGFYFTTESYGGHYAPIFNDYFLSQNKKNSEGAHKINLKAVLIGNGWYDPLIQYAAYYNFTVSPGNSYNYDPFNASIKDMMYTNMYGPHNCYDMTVECYTTGLDMVCSYADNWCYAHVESIFDIYAERDEYDIRFLTPDPFPPVYYVDYLNTEKVQSAIGAYVNFSESNHAVSQAFGSTGDDDRESGTVEAVKRILKAGVTLIMYAGDADYNCNWLGGQVVAHNVQAPGFEEAGFSNISSSDGVVHGQVRQAGNFAFARIYDSGHEVPFYKPLVGLEMFERVVKGMDIETGKVAITADYRTQGPKQSTYTEGNATIQTDIVGEDADVVYDVVTNLPVYENGTSANTGGPPGGKRGVQTKRKLSGKEKRRREKRLKDRKSRWRRTVREGLDRRVGAMRVPQA